MCVQGVGINLCRGESHYALMGLQWSHGHESEKSNKNAEKLGH